MNLATAELFADFFFQAVISAGGSRVTAHLCLAEWWRAVEGAEVRDATR